MVQDFVGTPQLRETLSSRDGKAWILPVGLAGDVASPKANAAYTRVADIVRHSVAGTTVTANLTGTAATVADVIDVSVRDQVRIEAAIVTLLLVILLIIYRNPITMLLPLITIGVSLAIAQTVLAGVSVLGLAVSNQTLVFLSGMIAGAGTDYAVFLISRYHDYLRHGADSDQAVKNALNSIGKVIAASAATVGVTFLGMTFTRLELFSTTGPALAIGIGVAFVAAVTLLPAIIVLTGRRGWIKPRRELTTRFWRRSGIRIVRRPKANLVASLIVLLILAGCVGVVRYNYDDRKALPAIRRQFPRIRRDGSTFLVELDDSPVPVDSIATRLADTKGACRHGTDGTADKPTARHQGDPGGNPTQRRHRWKPPAQRVRPARSASGWTTHLY